MDSFAYPIFQLISTLILSGYSTVVDAAIGRFGTSVMSIALAIETMYIMHYGYMIILQKSTEAVPNPSLRDLFYHFVIVSIVLYYVSTDVDTALGVVRALRRMIIDGLTGAMQTAPGEWSTGNLIGVPPIPGITATTPGGKVALELGLMNAAFAASNLLTVAPVMKDVSAPLQTTAFIMALVSDVSPQITAGIMLLINELMIRTGLALFPLALYCMLYKVTREFFHSWFNMMFAASIQMAVLIVTITICTKVTVSFLAALAVLSAADAGFNYMNSKVGSYVISELQESVIQAGFGITLTALIAWVPANSANFAGTLLTAGTTKSGVGMAMTSRTATPHQPYVRDTAQRVGRFIRGIVTKGMPNNTNPPTATTNNSIPFNPSANFNSSNASGTRPNPSANFNSSNASGTRPNPSANTNNSNARPDYNNINDRRLALEKSARETLGVTPNATPAEIRRAYRKEALKHHPDKNSSLESAARIRVINSAYEQLTKTNSFNASSSTPPTPSAYANTNNSSARSGASANSNTSSTGANPSTSSVGTNSNASANSNASNTSSNSIGRPTPSPQPSNRVPTTAELRASLDRINRISYPNASAGYNASNIRSNPKGITTPSPQPSNRVPTTAELRARLDRIKRPPTTAELRAMSDRAFARLESILLTPTNYNALAGYNASNTSPNPTGTNTPSTPSPQSSNTTIRDAELRARIESSQLPDEIAKINAELLARLDAI